MKFIKQELHLIILAWSICSFISWDINPQYWSWGIRIVFLAITIAFPIIMALLISFMEGYNEE